MSGGKVKRHFRIFVASAGDVQPERDAIPDVVTRVNRALSAQTDVHLELWRWENDAVPGLAKGGPQAQIDPELDQADIVILLVWNRMGVGTASEFERALKRWKRSGHPHVLIYVCARASRLDSSKALADRQAVVDFLDRIKTIALYQTYEQPDDVARLVHDHLLQLAPRL